MSEPAWKQRDPFAVSEQDANYRDGMRRMAEEQAAPVPKPMSALSKRFVTFMLLWFLATFGVYKAAEAVAIGVLAVAPSLDPSAQARLALWPQIAGGLFGMFAIVFGILLVLRAILSRGRRVRQRSLLGQVVRYGIVYLVGGLLAAGVAAAFVATAVLPA